MTFNNISLNVIKLSLLSFLLLILISNVSTKKLKSQYEVSCYDKCSCNKTTYKCENLREIDTDLFKHILPQIYPELDTISITGMDFGLLPKDNIFGNENIRHTKVSLLDLSDNNIRTFYADTFKGLPKVEYLYLRNNEIEAVGSKPLNHLTKLRLLDLSAAFADNISPYKKTELLHDILESDHKFKNLEEIILSNNDLQTINPETFCHIEGLDRLILSGNLIESFPIKEKCLQNLKLLNLRSNKISTISTDIFDKFESLDTLDISNNPLECSCKLESFIKFANEDSSVFLNQQQTRCSGPEKFAGKIIFTMEKENVCQRGSSFLHWMILILIGSGVLIIYRHLRKTGRFSNFYGTFGYSQLKRNDETNPSPAFV